MKIFWQKSQKLSAFSNILINVTSNLSNGILSFSSPWGLKISSRKIVKIVQLFLLNVLEERKSQKMMGKMMRNSRWCFYSRCFMKKVAGCINTVDRGPGSVALYDKKVQGEKAKTSTGQSNKLKACWELQGLTVSGNSLSLRGFNPLLSANEKIIEKYLDANICSLVYLMLC